MRNPVSVFLGWWDRQFCRFGRHSYGYHPVHDAVFCFACGRLAPLAEWRKHLRAMRSPEDVQ